MPRRSIELDLGVVPIPAAAIDAAGTAAGVGDPAAARARLAALGLLDVYTAAGSDAGSDGLAVNRFARPLVEPLDADERKASPRPPCRRWRRPGATPTATGPIDARGVEAARTALLAEAAERAAGGAGRLRPPLRRHRHRGAARAALALGEAALAAGAAGRAPDLRPGPAAGDERASGLILGA